jgi:hypothetical protein
MGIEPMGIEPMGIEPMGIDVGTICVVSTMLGRSELCVTDVPEE